MQEIGTGQRVHLREGDNIIFHGLAPAYQVASIDGNAATLQRIDSETILQALGRADLNRAYPKEIAVTRGKPTTIGRLQDNTVVINDTAGATSRYHARVELTDDGKLFYTHLSGSNKGLVEDSAQIEKAADSDRRDQDRGPSGPAR